MSEYFVYHPGTGTFINANDAFLVKAEDLPEEFDEWEDYMSWSGVRLWEIEVGNEEL